MKKLQLFLFFIVGSFNVFASTNDFVCAKQFSESSGLTNVGVSISTDILNNYYLTVEGNACAHTQKISPCITVTSTTNTSICQNQLPYNWNGNAYAAAGTYSVTLVSVAGCDSIATLNLTVYPNTTSTTNIIICYNQLPFSWNGNNYPAAGTYSVTLVNAAGCDSVLTLNLNVNPPPIINVSPITICVGQSGTLSAIGAVLYTWSPSTSLSAPTGASVSASPSITTTYTVSGINSNGCTASTSVVVTVSSCPTPTNISVSNITGTKATISWTGNSCAIKYRVRFRVQGTTTWVTKIVSAPVTTKTLTLLQPLTTYEFQVRTDCNSTGTLASSYSSTQTFTTICDCIKPTNIAISNVTQTGATVSWVGNSCAVKYRLQYRKQGTTTWTTKTITAPTIIYNISGLTSNTIYEYHLRSDCSSTGSLNSGFTTTSIITTAMRLEDAEIKSSSFFVSPNPCNTCEISGVENSTDLIITDIVGRKMDAMFTKSVSGYYINLPTDCKGIFLVRNIKTGEVVKFVKE